MSRSKFTKIYLLLGVLLVCCVVTLMISKREEKKELIKNSDEIVLSIDADAVSRLEWEYGENRLAFHKDEVWLYDEDEAFPVDEEKIGELLEVFREFGVSFVIEEVEDYSQYGLDTPTCTIRITKGEEEYEILLGAYSTMDEKRYVSLGDGKVYLVSHDPFEDYELELDGLIKHDRIPEFEEVSAIDFSGIEDYRIYYEEDSGKSYCAEDVYFTEEKPLSTASVSNYLSVLSNLELSDYVSYNVTEEELQEFGLDEPELVVTVDYTTENEEQERTEESLSLSVGRNRQEAEEAEESEEEDAESSVPVYVRVGDSQIVYQITTEEYEQLVAMTEQDLRHKEVLTADFEDVYQLDVTLEGEAYSFALKEGEEEEGAWYYRDTEEIEIASLESALLGMRADDFTKEEPSQKEEIGVTVYLENENYPEVQIGLYRYDGEYCLAVVDGEPTAFIPRSQAVELVEAVNSIVLSEGGND